MLYDINKEIKETEMFMLAQFIDVLDIIIKYKNIHEVRADILKRKKLYLDTIQKNSEKINLKHLNFNEDVIDNKINRCKKIYSENQKVNEVYLAYKIGVIDGMKVKK